MPVAGAKALELPRAWCNAPGRSVVMLVFLGLLGPVLGMAQGRHAGRPLSDFMMIGAPQIRLGSEDARGPELFGDIRSVTMDREGNLFVLDGTSHSVRAFDRAGRYLSSAGGPGRGPGDLRDPLLIWHDGEHLYVVDRYDGISRFVLAGGTLQYAGRFAADLKPTALCSIGEELFIGAISKNGILHVVSRDGRARRAFGTPLRQDPNPAIQEHYDRHSLRMTCDSESRRLYVAETTQSRVRAYEPGGRQLWETDLPQYHGDTVRVNRNPVGVAVFWGSHQTRTVTRIGRDLLVVQARYVSRRRNPSNPSSLLEEDHDVVTWVLSAATGHVLTRQGGAPFLAHSRGAVTVGYVLDPVPQVLIMAVHERMR